MHSLGCIYCHPIFPYWTCYNLQIPYCRTSTVFNLMQITKYTTIFIHWKTHRWSIMCVVVDIELYTKLTMRLLKLSSDIRHSSSAVWYVFIIVTWPGGDAVVMWIDVEDLPIDGQEILSTSVSVEIWSKVVDVYGFSHPFAEPVHLMVKHRHVLLREWVGVFFCMKKNASLGISRMMKLAKW